jgi:hypothetical protein
LGCQWQPVPVKANNNKENTGWLQFDAEAPFTILGHWTCFLVLPVENIVIHFDTSVSPNRHTCLMMMLGKNPYHKHMQILIGAMHLCAEHEGSIFVAGGWQIACDSSG